MDFNRRWGNLSTRSGKNWSGRQAENNRVGLFGK